MNATGIDGINLEATLSTKYLGRDQRAINQFLEMWQPPVTPLPVPQNNTTVALAPTAEAAEASTEAPTKPTTDASTTNQSEPSEYLPSETPTLTSQVEDPSSGTTETEDTVSESSEQPTNATTPVQQPTKTETETTNNQQSANEEQQQHVDEYEVDEDVFDPASNV